MTESAVSWGRGPQKSCRDNIRVRVRALTVMDIEFHVRARLPCGEVTERCEDQDESKDLRRYGPCYLWPVCASQWAKCGRVNTTFRPVFFISSWMYKIIYKLIKQNNIDMITIDFLYLIKFYSSWLLDASSSSKGWVGGIFLLCCRSQRPLKQEWTEIKLC